MRDKRKINIEKKPEIVSIQGGKKHDPVKKDSIDLADAPANIRRDWTESHQELTDLIGHAPGWILKSGISIVGLVTILILVMSHLIKYPDKIESTGILTTELPPIAHYSTVKAVVDEVFVSERDMISRDDPIVYLHNSARREDVNELIHFMDKYKNSNKAEFALNNKIPENLIVGNMQSLYANLILRYNEYRHVLRQNGTALQTNMISNEIEQTHRLIGIQEEERELFKQELDLVVREDQRNKKLNRNGLLSASENELGQARVAQYKRRYKGMTNGIIIDEIRIEQLHQQSVQLREERAAQLNGLHFSLSELVSQLEEEYQKWQDTYFVRAEISGTISLTNKLAPKITLSPENIICYVLPQVENNRYLVKALVPSGEMRKLDKGDKALIKFDVYPHKDYGSITDQVERISLLPFSGNNLEKQYEITIVIEDDLITDYGKTLDYWPEMSARVSLITEDKSILQRILGQLLSLIKQ